MSATSTLIAVLVAQRQKLERELRDAGALSPETAVPLQALHKVRAGTLKRCQALGVVRETSGAIYLDEARAEDLQKIDRSRVVIGLLVALILLAGLGAYVALQPAS